MRRLETLVVVAAIVLTLLSIGAKLQRRPQVAGDVAVACGGANAMEAGEDPYDPRVLSRYANTPGIPMTYPPLLAQAFTPACGSPLAVPVLWALLAAVAVAILRLVVALPLLTLIAVVVTGFGAFEWTVLAGNPSILELPLMAAALLALSRGRAATFGGLIGVLAFSKVTPFSYLIAAAPRLRTRAIAMAAGVSLLVFVTLHALSMLIYPSFTRSYWHGLTGGLNAFLEFERRDGGEGHPALISLAYDLSRTAGLGGIGALALYLAGAAAILWLAFLAWRSRDVRPQIQTGAILLVLVAIALPRLKPYAFAALVPALAVILAALPPRRGLLLIALACIAPTLAFAATAVLRPDPFLHPSPLYKILFGYAQLYAAGAAAAMALLPRHPLRPRTSVAPAVVRCGTRYK